MSFGALHASSGRQDTSLPISRYIIDNANIFMLYKHIEFGKY